MKKIFFALMVLFLIGGILGTAGCNVNQTGSSPYETSTQNNGGGGGGGGIQITGDDATQIRKTLEALYQAMDRGQYSEAEKYFTNWVRLSFRFRGTWADELKFKAECQRQRESSWYDFGEFQVVNVDLGANWATQNEPGQWAIAHITVAITDKNGRTERLNTDEYLQKEDGAWRISLPPSADSSNSIWFAKWCY